MIVCTPLGDALVGFDALGRAAEANALGAPHSIYRPTAPTAAIAPANLIGATPFVPSASPDGMFKKPSAWTQPDTYGVIDPRAVMVGDYLVGASGTFFVGSLEQFTRPLMTQCNVVVDIGRFGGWQLGLNPIYNGNYSTQCDALMTGWPASLLPGGNSEAPRTGLPDDPKRAAGALCKLPQVPGVTFRIGDQLTVENGDQWLVAGAFLQQQGWQLRLVGSEG